MILDDPFMSQYVIFPNQLFAEVIPKDVLSKVANVILIEERSAFYDPNIGLKFHKRKLAWLVACMRNYYDNVLVPFCRKHKLDCQYIPYSKTIKPSSSKNVIARDPVDHTIKDKYNKLYNVTWLETPMFVLDSRDLLKARERNIRRNVGLFNLVKAKLNKYQDLKSHDKDNREALPKKDLSIGKDVGLPRYKSKYYAQAALYVEKHFKSHIGSPSMNLEELPISRQDAIKHLTTFLDKRFSNYGKYQDAIDRDNVVIYHSHLSYLLNVGLLTPLEVVDEAERAYKTANISISAFEGFIRQILGWREYMRYIYVMHRDQLDAVFHKPKPKNTDMTPWYTATTGNEVVDTEITKAIENAWAHHIIRLMVFLNYAKLLNLNASAILKWFSEVVALDAWPWVMESNIGVMGYYTKNKFTHKPYVSSCNYILKMSRGYKRGPWCEMWNALYGAFENQKK